MRPLLPYSACSALGVGIGLACGLALSERTPLPVPSPATRPVDRSFPTAHPSPASVPAPAHDLSSVLETFLTTEWSDSVALISSSGEIAALSDVSVRRAWDILLARSRQGTHQEYALSLYLWSRLARLSPGFPYPESWTLNANPDAILAERVRQSMDEITRRLRAREFVNDLERRAFFVELCKKDARAALDFWFEVSNPLEQFGEISLFSDLVRDPATREATLARLRAWSSDKSSVDDLIIGLAHPWIISDVAGASAWIDALSDPDLRTRLITKLAIVQGSTRPNDAFRWSESLPFTQRLAARSMSINQLAYDDPAAGMILIDSVKDADERTALVKAFGNTLSLNDIESWLIWRDSLPTAERDAVNTAGFGAWAVKKPASASDWLKAQPAGQTRDELATELVRITAASDTPTAINWINAIQNPRDRMIAISMAIGNLPPGDTERMHAILRAAAITPSPAP